jgi:hypothetical protein
MSFTIRLSQDLTAVEAGSTVPLSIEITNKGDSVDRFEMQVEGLDPEWTASPEPVFSVGAGETHSQKVFFKPPRSSESSSGNYPFVVKVRSLESGDSRTAQGVLQIKPFHHLSMEISPKKGYSSPTRLQNTFTVTVMNLGNTEHTLQLTGADPEEACTYDFAQDQVTVGPGQQKSVEVSVNTARPGIVSSSRLFGFSIAARSIQNPNVMASTQGQLEQRPLLSVAGLAFIALIILVGLIWYSFRPQPPSITVWVDKADLTKGDSTTFHWKASNAKFVKLEIHRGFPDGRGGTRIESSEPTARGLEGEEPITTTAEDTVSIKATAVADGDRSVVSDPVTINVKDRPAVPQPTLTKFEASTHTARMGEPVTLTFDYGSDVTKLVLSPTNQEIAPPIRQIEVTPNHPGSVEYQLVAFNKEGGSKSRKLTIEVISAANIIEFKLDAGFASASGHHRPRQMERYRSRDRAIR